ncbi:MAG: hypothetical protein Fur003_5760 [Candidatus Dojkabacteria bacterium]
MDQFKVLLKKKSVRVSLITILSILFIAFLILAVLRPEFKVGFVKSDTFPVSDLALNATEKAKTLNFTTDHLITFSGGSEYRSNSLKLNESDLEEGENIVTACGYLDYGIIKFKSSQCSELVVLVDRNAPTLTAESLSPEFVLLTDFQFTVTSEKGATILNNNKSIGTLSEATQKISITAVDGENKIVLTAKDEAGNLSDPVEFSFKAFNKANFTLFKCGEIAIPIGPTQQVGFLDEPADSEKFTKCKDLSAPSFRIVGVGEKYIAPPCTECDYIPEFSDSTITMFKHNGKAVDVIGHYSTNFADSEITNKVVKKEDRTTNAGIKGTLLIADYEGPFGKDRVTFFTVEKGSYSYIFSKVSDYGVSMAQVYYDEFLGVVDNMVFLPANL